VQSTFIALLYSSKVMFSNMSWSSFIICSVLFLTTSTTRAEIRSFEGIIDADSSYIHYSEGFLITPGSIDLSQLVFTVALGTDLLNDHDDVVGNQDDDNGNRFLTDAKDTNEAGSTVRTFLREISLSQVYSAFLTH
jgi:hypothetical protein